MATVASLEAYWSLIELADFAQLDAVLAQLDLVGLENVHGLTTIPAWDACIEDDLFYEADGAYLSEDGMESFGWWAVMQGRAFHDALTDESLPLQDALAMHMGHREPPRRWRSGDGRRYRSTNLLSLVEEVARDRFGAWRVDQEQAGRNRAYAIRESR